VEEEHPDLFLKLFLALLLDLLLLVHSHHTEVVVDDIPSPLVLRVDPVLVHHHPTLPPMASRKQWVGSHQSVDAYFQVMIVYEVMIVYDADLALPSLPPPFLTLPQ
jgi:hypothetical protein